MALALKPTLEAIMLKIREAPFALRVIERTDGTVAIVYRRRANANGRDRLQRIGTIGPLAFTAGTPLLRDAVAKTQNGKRNGAPPPTPKPGKFHPLNQEWGSRVALYCLTGAGLREANRLSLAATNLRSANADEAAWWLGQLTRDNSVRPLRALRILIEAVE